MNAIKAMSTRKYPFRHHVRLMLLIGGILLTGLPPAWVMKHHAPASIVAAAQLHETDGVVILEPAHWAGQPLPLFDQIDIGQQLKAGRWKVLFVHYDCPDCRQVSMRLAQMREPSEKLAMVEVPPYGNLSGEDQLKAEGIVFGKLSDKRDWFAATPILLALEDGQVTAVQEREQLAVDKPAAAAPTTRPENLVELKRKAEKDPVHLRGDLGYVPPDSKTDHVLMLINPLTKPIVIRKVDSECQCMTIRSAPREIAAGASGRIELSFHAPAQIEEYAKQLTILTDAPEVPSILVQLCARVGLPISIMPQIIDLGTLTPGQTIRKSLTVHNEGKGSVKLLYSTSADTTVAVPVPQEAIPAGGQLEVPFSFTAPKDPTAPGEGTILIHSDCPVQPMLRLQVRYQVK